MARNADGTARRAPLQVLYAPALHSVSNPYLSGTIIEGTADHLIPNRRVWSAGERNHA
jgi:hypothetical protein